MACSIPPGEQLKNKELHEQLKKHFELEMKEYELKKTKRKEQERVREAKRVRLSAAAHAAEGDSYVHWLAGLEQLPKPPSRAEPPTDADLQALLERSFLA